MTDRVSSAGVNSGAAGVSGSGVSGSGVVAVPSGGSLYTSSPATLNPALKAASLTLTESNQTVTCGVGQGGVYGTVGVSNGKRYYEALVGTTGSVHSFGVGVAGLTLDGAVTTQAGSTLFERYHILVNGTNQGDIFTFLDAGEIVSILVDFDARTFKVWQNGVETHTATAATNAGATYFPWFILNNTHFHSMRFDPSTWTYTPPAGYDSWF